MVIKSMTAMSGISLAVMSLSAFSAPLPTSEDKWDDRFRNLRYLKGAE